MFNVRGRPDDRINAPGGSDILPGVKVKPKKIPAKKFTLEDARVKIEALEAEVHGLKAQKRKSLLLIRNISLGIVASLALAGVVLLISHDNPKAELIEVDAGPR